MLKVIISSIVVQIVITDDRHLQVRGSKAMKKCHSMLTNILRYITSRTYRGHEYSTRWQIEAGEQIRVNFNQLSVLELHPQILAANIICLVELIYGACNATPSTLLYSFEKGSEGISMSLEEASWARKYTNKI